MLKVGQHDCDTVFRIGPGHALDVPGTWRAVSTCVVSPAPASDVDMGNTIIGPGTVAAFAA